MSMTEANRTGALLLVDDDENLRRVLSMQLSEAGHDVAVAASGDEALSRLSSRTYDVILTDLRMPGLDGMSFLAEIKREDPDAAVIMMTAHGDVETAVRALKEGAFDFLSKPVSRAQLLGAVSRALNFRRLYFAVARQREALHQHYSFERIVGASPQMQAAYELVRRAAPRDASVLIRGETGTGKELFARAIHHNSRRADGPFVSLNCAAVPEQLLESAFFGHEKGAFTGAVSRHIGCYEEAHRGTLFLDEVGLLDKQLQGKLLRVLETGVVRPVGGTRDRRFDVRIVAATSSPLEEMIPAGEFREDLYFRLCVIEIHLPPLRERIEDLSLLVDSLLVELGSPNVTVTPEAMERLASYSWPGNVRELKNVLERAVILARDPERLDAGDIDVDVADGLDPLAAASGEASDIVARIAVPKDGIDVARVERQLLEIALEQAHGNQSRAASFLGLGRHAFLYRLKKHGLAPPLPRGPGSP